MILNILLASILKAALCANELRISDSDGFIEFANNVANGSTYSGTTVYLDEDIAFGSEPLTPIGVTESNYFGGTFDGQGYTISGLKIASASNQYSGLFGYSKGMTIRNLVLDDSSSVKFSYNDSTTAYIGAFIGHCHAEKASCTIENSVNMASVTFDGKAKSELRLGGIAGVLKSFINKGVSLVNCANYGSVTNSGESDVVYHGGIVGDFNKDAQGRAAYIQNAINYGDIVFSGTCKGGVSSFGGIAGQSSAGVIANCMSTGKINLSGKKSNTVYSGSIVGWVLGSLSINHSFWTSDVGCSKACDECASATVSESSQVELNTAIVGKLNDYSEKGRSWNKWLLNSGKASVSFQINENTPITLKSQLILLPGPANNSDRTFGGWFRDEDISSPFTASEIKSDTTLYGLFCGSSNYTVTLDVNGGDELSVKEVSVKCGEPYGNLPTPSKVNYSFAGWLNCKGKVVTKESIVNILRDHTLTAEWSEDHSGINSGDTVILIVVAVIIVVVVIVVIIVIVLRKKRRSNGDEGGLTKALINDEINERGDDLIVSEPEKHSQTSVFWDGRDCHFVEDTLDEEALVAVSQGPLLSLYPKSYTRPTMKDVLTEAGLIEKQVKLICSACETSARKNADDGKLFEGFTEEDAAAVAMYTYDLGPNDFESNPYRIINKSLVGRSFADLQRASGLLYLVVSALRKLPRVTGRTLYRGVKCEVNLDNKHYCKGNVMTWSALSSTTPGMEVTKVFLAKGSKSGKAAGTLFIIEDGWGYDIQPYSLFPGEEEIILEPERQFEVDSVVPGDGLTVINLKMLDTPLVLPEVFGEGKNE